MHTIMKMETSEEQPYQFIMEDLQKVLLKITQDVPTGIDDSANNMISEDVKSHHEITEKIPMETEDDPPKLGFRIDDLPELGTKISDFDETLLHLQHEYEEEPDLRNIVTSTYQRVVDPNTTPEESELFKNIQELSFLIEAESAEPCTTFEHEVTIKSASQRVNDWLCEDLITFPLSPEKFVDYNEQQNSSLAQSINEISNNLQLFKLLENKDSETPPVMIQSDKSTEEKFPSHQICKAFTKSRTPAKQVPSEVRTLELDNTIDKISEQDVSYKETFRPSALAHMQSKLDPVTFYSPARLGLAACFEKLRIDYTPQQKELLTCEARSDPQNEQQNVNFGPENQETEVGSIGQQTTFTDGNKEECPETEDDIPSTGQSSHLLVIPDAEKNYDQVSSASSDDDTVANVSSISDETSNSNYLSLDENESVMSVGVQTYQTTGFTGNQTETDIDVFNVALNSSPTVVQRHFPQYEQYYNFKLEINALQQTVAKLTIKLKEKESTILSLQMHNARQSLDNVPVDRREAWTELDSLVIQKHEYITENKKLKMENEALIEEISKNQEKIRCIEDEIESIKCERDELKDATTGNESSLMTFFQALLDFQKRYIETRKELAIKSILLDDIKKKYDTALQIIKGYVFNEKIYKETVYKLSEGFTDLRLSYETSQKTLTEKLNNENKENEEKGAIPEKEPPEGGVRKRATLKRSYHNI